MYRSKRNIMPWIIGLLVLLAVSWLFVALKSILTPFIAAAILAYILSPMVDKISSRYISRGMAAMLVMLLAFTIVIVLLLIVVPMLLEQLHSMIERIPSFISWVHLTALPKINQTFNTNYQLNTNTVMSIWQANSEEIKNTLTKLTPLLAKKGGVVMSSLMNIIILPFLLYYFLLDWQQWVEGVKKLIPRRFVNTSNRIMSNLDKVLGEFLRGQLLVMMIMGVLYGGGLSILGLDNGFAIGMLAGLLVFIPYLGAFTGLLLATLAALLQFDTPTGLFLVWGVFAIGQFIESFLITPYLVGEKIGLSPLMVIFALMAFGQLMGFVGMLLALPMAAICLVLYREAIAAYTNSNLYSNK